MYSIYVKYSKKDLLYVNYIRYCCIGHVRTINLGYTYPYTNPVLSPLVTFETFTDQMFVRRMNYLKKYDKERELLS